MDPSGLNPLAHFTELDLLPRAIFSIGAALFVTALFFRNLRLGLLGVGLVFAGIALKFTFDVVYRDQGEARKLHVAWEVAIQLVLAIMLAAGCLYVAFYSYRHQELPGCLRPTPHPGASPLIVTL